MPIVICTTLLLSHMITLPLIPTATEITSPSLAQRILSDSDLQDVATQAETLVQSGFTAGTVYAEVWIRDLATFIELSCAVVDHERIRENLLMFFKIQGPQGDIVDGFVPRTAKGNYAYRFSALAPDYKAHKNTVETDQETSLVQAITHYVRVTGDRNILQEKIVDKSVLDRLVWCMEYLLAERYASTYGLLWGATTVDWGDVQPEHPWGVALDKNTHRTVDIYDNAMFLIALDNLVELLGGAEAPAAQRWVQTHQRIRQNIRKHLWDDKKQQFIPHLYLNGSPFPPDFDESSLYYHGGTAVAIQAGLLSRDEIAASLARMQENVRACGAGSIGLTVYPPYPQGFFQNKSMRPYGYQNGGDWTWFGGRMIQQLVRYGFIAEAYQELRPMVQRVLKNKGFYEWYDIYNRPQGAGKFRGSAGVLHKAIQMLQAWAREQQNSAPVTP